MSVAERAALLAERWVGTPYRHQGAVRGAGADCLGLVRGVRRELGFEDVRVPAYAPGWGEGADEGEPLLRAARLFLQPRQGLAPTTGDVIVFRMVERGPAKHCAIALGPDRFVHAYAGVGTVVSALSEPWRRRIAGLFAFPEPDEPEHAGPGSDEPGSKELRA